MNNANFPRGFQAYNDKGVQTVLIEGTVSSGNATSIGSGDVVTQQANGTIARCAAGEATIQLGVAVAFKNTNGIYIQQLPTLTEGKVYFIPFLGNRFLVQTSGTGIVVAADVGRLVDLVVTGDADSVTGVSKMEIDFDTIASPGTQFRIEGKSPDSNWDEANTRLIVSAETYVGNTGTINI